MDTTFYNSNRNNKTGRWLFIVLILCVVGSAWTLLRNTDTHSKKNLLGDFDNDGKPETVILENRQIDQMGEVRIETELNSIVLAENFNLPDSKLYNLNLTTISSGKRYLIVADVSRFVNGTGAAHEAYVFEYDKGTLNEIWSSDEDEALAYSWLAENAINISPPHFLTWPVNFVVDSETVFHMVYQLEGLNENQEKMIGILKRYYELSPEQLEPIKTTVKVIYSGVSDESAIE